jgi:metal transporter CNNM
VAGTRAGEIVPQSVCTRYGLAVGYYSSWLVRLLMIIAWPVAWPLGKVLDYILGHGEHALPRSQLQHYVALHSEEERFANAGEGLTTNELRVINSALELTSKTARTAMTPLDKVFMVSQDDVMDEALVNKIMLMGHSRVPVYSAGDRTNIVGLVLVKELLLKVDVRPRITRDKC